MAPSAAAPAAGQVGEGAGAAAAAEPATDQWVQCDRCRTWRIVPDSEWPKVEADPRDVRPALPCDPNLFRALYPTARGPRWRRTHATCAPYSLLP